jgi:hypothetical protein
MKSSQGARPDRGPQGKHIILIEELTTPHRSFSEREWLKGRED